MLISAADLDRRYYASMVLLLPQYHFSVLARTAGSTSPPIYQPSDKAKFVAMLKADLDGLEASHHGVYLGFTKLRRLTDTSSSKLQSIWENDIRVTLTWVDTTQSHEEDVNTTLWELGNDFIAAGREIMSNAA